MSFLVDFVMNLIPKRMTVYSSVNKCSFAVLPNYLINGLFDLFSFVFVHNPPPLRNGLIFADDGHIAKLCLNTPFSIDARVCWRHKIYLYATKSKNNHI